MNAQRSMTDKELAARWDEEPIEAVCSVDHRPEGAGPGAVVARFADMQSASNRQIEDSYPRCIIEYRFAPRPECIPSRTCPDCNGAGLVSYMQYNGREDTYECPTCKGDGCVERPPVNPILSAARRMIASWHNGTINEAKRMLSCIKTTHPEDRAQNRIEYDYDMFVVATPDQVEFARAVLTRLANLTAVSS